jgi:hypothetical protein
MLPEDTNTLHEFCDRDKDGKLSLSELQWFINFQANKDKAVPRPPKNSQAPRHRRPSMVAIQRAKQAGVYRPPKSKTNYPPHIEGIMKLTNLMKAQGLRATDLFRNPAVTGASGFADKASSDATNMTRSGYWLKGRVTQTRKHEDMLTWRSFFQKCQALGWEVNKTELDACCKFLDEDRDGNITVKKHTRVVSCSFCLFNSVRRAKARAE